MPAPPALGALGAIQQPPLLIPTPRALGQGGAGSPRSRLRAHLQAQAQGQETAPTPAPTPTPTHAAPPGQTPPAGGVVRISEGHSGRDDRTLDDRTLFMAEMNAYNATKEVRWAAN